MNDNMTDYYNFLMMNLSEINDQEFDSPSKVAYEVCILLSLNKDSIPESFYKMYTCNIHVPEVIMTNALAYFSGAKFLSVACDCSEDDAYFCNFANIADNQFYELGSLDKKHATDDWTAIDQCVTALGAKIFGLDS